MANIRIKDLPSDGAPKQTDLIPIDLGSTRHATVKAVVESGRPTASKAEAEAGVEPQKAMTPLTTKQAIDAQVGASYVPKTVKVNAGSGMTGGGGLSGDVTIGLSAVSTASLAKADSAVQSVNGKTGSSITLTKADVGLSNVDNTSDASKPVSTATQTALNAKANSSVTVSAGTGLTGGGNLTANRSIALNAASVSSLAKADTAIQAPGGSAGQILAKNSGADNDVLWVSSEAATAVSYGPQELTEAQQGQARANIGADVISGFRNKIINGNFDVWQRGDNFTGSGFSADRWQSNMAGTFTISRVNAGTGSGIPGAPQFGLRFNRTVAATSGNVVLAQKIEGLRQFSGQRVTLTFYIRNLTSTAKEIRTRAEMNYGSGGSASQSLSNQIHRIAVAPEFQKFTHVFDVPSVSGKTFGSGDHLLVRFLEESSYSTFEIVFAHISLVIGDASAEYDPFSPRHIQQELALCQRYFEETTFPGYYGSSISGLLRGGAGFRTSKRVVPTVTSAAQLVYNDAGDTASADTYIITPFTSGYQILAGKAAGIRGMPPVTVRADAEL